MGVTFVAGAERCAVPAVSCEELLAGLGFGQGVTATGDRTCPPRGARRRRRRSARRRRRARGWTRAGPGRVDRDPLRGVLTGGVARAGRLAMRLGARASRRPDDSPLVACEVCGTLDAEIACDPLVCAGEAIGILLVAGRARSPRRAGRLRAAAATAAPILARQRERALAEERAVSDALTGLPNRRAADEHAATDGSACGAGAQPAGGRADRPRPLPLLNDRHGHSHGDRALTAFGRLLGEAVRASDFAARLGGRSSSSSCRTPTASVSIEVAEKVRGRLERTPLVATGPITASFGVASLPEDAVDIEQLLRRADRALHLAKVQGRNRVVAAHTWTGASARRWGSRLVCGARRGRQPGPSGARREVVRRVGRHAGANLEHDLGVRAPAATPPGRPRPRRPPT